MKQDEDDEERVQLSLRIRASLHRRLKAYCAARQLAVTSVIPMLIEDWIPKGFKDDAPPPKRSPRS